ncbi:MAG: EAL domain-containing protein [Rhodocyclaceae bacterium]|jgi:diguanylate cyclase (GGDEF)-like protein/PAS domain S-box-containing protein|nr:EAL domain-containing protein [Rhodocyclaceae bacterium]
MTDHSNGPGPQLTHQTALLRVLMETPSDIAVIATDRDFRIRDINPVACRLFAVTPEAVLGRSVPEIHVDQGVSEARFEQAIARALETGEHAFTQKLGTGAGARHLESRLLPLRDPQATVCGFVLMARDVTERVAAESRERMLLRAVDQSPVSILITDTEGVIEYVNARFSQTSGYSVEEVVGRRMGFLKSGQTLPQTYAELWQAIRSGREWSGELLNRRKSGELYWDSVRIMPVTDASGTVTHFVGLQEDISSRRATEENLRLWATVFENSTEAVMIADPGNRIISVNGAYTRITGFRPEEVIGKTPSIVMLSRQDPHFLRDLRRKLAEEGSWEGEVWDRRKNGEVYPKWFGITAVRDAHGTLTHYVAIFTDISERKEAEARIEFLAHHDALTRLPNRILLRDRLEQALAHAERAGTRVALLFLDLDRFKTINDSLGHAVGDQLLLALVQRLGACVRDTDTISRLGGDEFVVVLTELRDADAAATVAQKIVEVMSAPFDIDTHHLTTSFSIGISLHPEDGYDFDTLLKKADTAMYHAKDGGRNTYRFFTEQMNVHALERLMIQSRMRQALEQAEFVLLYQPQIELGGGRVFGVEALARWNNPELGMLGPDRFIPIAEESGQIVTLGAWVLREACRQGQAWRAGGRRLSVAVNVSPLQLQQADFCDIVHQALDASGFDPALLELELTESALIQNAESTLETVRRLKALGIRISIDDFGIGYSSLSYLKRFAVDRIKIDRSFIRDILTDPEDAAIVRAVIQMARSLNLKTLAEGVETQEQLDYLRSEQCGEVQGFLYARPLPADAVIDRITVDGILRS